ncbi:DUF3592 domain-containing protein [Streptomyces corynorhini]|uniref:DUF3592 domain-containing protein n=1 Tax=Streptomyces corynorhini TaxID=2282652 RepID=A0A370B7I9_9ACTN|nr:DUF3592 domain-containing protein [Streptomyces corynorhini]RDG35395.1 DUF3592 domain-containing protein [Streptomyces corynorhini]
MDVPGGEYVFFVGMILLFGWLAAHYGRRLAAVVRALRADGRAPGVCVRVETEPYHRSDARRYFFAFRPAGDPDGAEIEFEDLATRSTRVGTRVTVAYDPAAPGRTATVAGPGNRSPVAQYALLVTGCALAAACFTAVFLLTVW